MKALKQNNPVVIGALIVVFGAMMFAVFSEVRHVSAATKASSTTVIMMGESSSLPGATVHFNGDFVRPAITRDPFQHPQAAVGAFAPQAAGLITKASMPGGTGTAAIRPEFMPPLTGLTAVQPLPIATLDHPKSMGINMSPSTLGGGAGPTPTEKTGSSADSIAKSDSDGPTLQVTAIVGGSVLTAVVEGAGPPTVVKSGDQIAGYHVEAIRANGIVLSSARGVFTVPVTAGTSSDSSQSATHGDTTPPSEDKLNATN